MLRRLPKQILVPRPNADQRRNILDLLLRDIDLALDFDMNTLIIATEGLSGSELKELCRNAAMQPLRELMRDTEDLSLLQSSSSRPVTLQDFLTNPAISVQAEGPD